MEEFLEQMRQSHGGEVIQSTIAAIASPPGAGAVALVRLSGPQALNIAQHLLRGLTTSNRAGSAIV